MPKRSSKKPKEVNIIASEIIGKATNESATTKNLAAVALGRLGGLKGGKARAEKYSPEKRKEIAKKAAQVKWGK